MKTFRIDAETAERIRYLQGVYREWYGEGQTVSEILRILIADAVLRIESVHYYQNNKHKTQQESTDELGK